METLPAPPTQRPALRRDPSRKAIAGVAMGLAQHLGVSVTLVRIGFVALTVFGFFSGAALYALLWVTVPVAQPSEASGLEAAARTGKRPAKRAGRADPAIIVSAGLVTVGIAWMIFYDRMISPEVFWPLVVGAVGVVLIWLQVDHSEKQPVPANPTWWYRISRGTGTSSLMRLVGGLALFLLGASWLLAAQIGVAELPAVLGASAVLVGGVLLVAAPWLHRIRTRIRRADEERLRAEAKADMAAHLHDSVLQTLTLIQKQSRDGAAVASLARRQERELRAWLYGAEVREQTLKGALVEIGGDVEANFDIAVEVVCVGDVDLDESNHALVLASREAVTNAAKHSGVDRVDVYAEVEPETIEVFVRDRGRGFDPTQIPEDRHGVKQSIRARMERHGGSVRIRSFVGSGTEITLEMPR